MANVLVLNPPFKTEHGKYSSQSRSPSISKGGTVYYPYFLAYAVGVLEQHGHKVDFIDACANQFLRDELPMIVRSYPDLIVVGSTTPSIYEDIKTADFLKERYPNAIVVMVGTHATFRTDDVFFASNGIDAIARGEYDYTILDLANKKPLNEIKGLSWRFTNKVDVAHNEDRPPIVNLDVLPFVSKVYQKHLDVKDYFFAASDYPMVQILSGRGCLWGNCTFCMTPAFEGRGYRKRSVENFVDELEWISKNMPEVKEIGIEDGCFGPNKRIQEICQSILRRKLKIKWYCNVRVDCDAITMFWMKQAGCHLVTVGFESSNQQVLNNIRKGTTIEQMYRFVGNAKKEGLLVHGCFMSGNPGDTKQILKENLELAKRLGCDTMQFFPLMVYPGTESYNWAEKNKLITEKRWDKWVTDDGQYNTVISLPHLPKEELVKISNESVKVYHTRPAYIFYKAMRVLAHPDEFMRTAKGFKSFVKTILRREK